MTMPFRSLALNAVLLLGLVGIVLLVGADAGRVLRASQVGMPVEPIVTRRPPLVAFAVVPEVAIVAVGLAGTCVDCPELGSMRTEAAIAGLVAWPDRPHRGVTRGRALVR